MNPAETPDQLEADYVRIRRNFTILAAVTAGVFIGNIVVCRFALHLNAVQISAVSGILFQVLGAVWAVAFLGSYAVRMEKKTDLSVRMGRTAVELAQQSARTMGKMQDEIAPIVSDVKAVIVDVREMVQRFKDNDFGKYQIEMHKLMKDGTIDKVLAALQKFGEIPEKLDELIRSAKSTGVNKFLGI